jgi:hypothetical protein
VTLTTGAKRVAIIVAIAWMVVSALGGGAMAADRGRSARAHTAAARAYFKLEKYREAIGEYEQAYLDKRDPTHFFEIAECYRLLSTFPEAQRFYRRFLQDAPRGHAHRATAEARLAEVTQAIEQAERDSQAAAASPPGAPPGSRPLPPSFPPSAHYLPPLPSSGDANRGAPVSSSRPAATSVAPPERAAAPSAPALGTQPASWHTGNTGSAPAPRANAAPPLARADAPGGLSSTSVSTAPNPEPAYGPPALVAAPTSEPSATRPVYARWWFWTLLGGAVAGGVVAGLIVTSSRPSRPSCPAGVSCQ